MTNTERNVIRISREQLYDFVPFGLGDFNNAWKCVEDRETGEIRMVSIFKFSWILGAIALPGICFAIALVLYAHLDQLGVHRDFFRFFIVGLCGFGVLFLIVPVIAIERGLNSVRETWGHCRLAYSPADGSLTVLDRYTYLKDDYKQLRLAIISGYDSFSSIENDIVLGNVQIPSRGASVGIELWLLVLTSKNRWRKHLIAYEGFSGHTRRMARYLADQLSGDVVEQSQSFSECRNSYARYSDELKSLIRNVGVLGVFECDEQENQ